MKNENKRPSARQVVLAGYLCSFIPATDLTDENLVLKSSQDIQDDLAQMVELTLDDIATELVSVGYRVTVDDGGQLKWMMARRT